MVAATVRLLSGTPAPVQIILTGVPAGTPWLIEGHSTHGTWEVPGCVGAGHGEQIVRTDNRAALNTPITYRVTVGDETITTASVRVDYPDGTGSDVLLQSLDGRTGVAPILTADGLERALGLRVATMQPAGRRTPVSSWDTTTRGGSTFTVLCTPAQSNTLEALLCGPPIVYRAVAPIRDLPPVAVIQVTAAESESIPDGDRQWELAWTFISDPEPSTPVALATWGEVEAAVAGTWGEAEALIAGTWGQAEAFDWAGL